ncbi:flagellar hook-associated protein FlgK [Paenalcaligenes niemegkensis]|uniref:flagellar hook-associated protein FlgK n=1 Tax=Paenalcaligenes niemegkensis TaxID=2895469 RepID=UPI001EE961DF|nr:flagellar hook-associated protein FlgK [Paenalcaligenes niemegkensis]MCQ9615992.1 flagellar hook-associated protein FlgK [Paenalcaligenes niemegkensis]
MNLSSLGKSALLNAQNNLQTIGHNINNAAVEGYSRQTVLSQTAGASSTGAGYIGRGVQAVTVQRAYDGFLSGQLVKAQSTGAALVSYGHEIAQVNNLFSDRTVGINPAIQNFFDGLNAVASAPADPAARQELLGRAESLVTQLNDANSFLQNQRQNINTQLQTTVSQVNSYLERINELNQQVSAAVASSPQHTPNDLLDQRDQLVSELNQLVDVKVHEQDEVFNLTIGNGQVVLGAGKVFPLKVQPAHGDPSRSVIAYTSAIVNGEPQMVQLNDSAFKGGQLGGLLQYREQSLDATQNALGRLAIGIADQINQVHQQGYDLAGNTGIEFFNFKPGTPIPSNKTGVAPGPQLSIEFDDTSKLSGSDYLIEYKDDKYMMRTLPNGIAQEIDVSGPVIVDGISFSFTESDTAVEGDSWLIQPTRHAAGDISVAIKDPAQVAASGADTEGNPLGSANGENALKLAALQTEKTLGNGTLSFNDAFGQIVNKVAVQAQQNGTSANAQASLIQQNFAAQQRVAGVNLNEEYLMLDRYVEQFRAASRLIEVSSSMFDTLLGMRN